MGGGAGTAETRQASTRQIHQPIMHLIVMMMTILAEHDLRSKPIER